MESDRVGLCADGVALRSWLSFCLFHNYSMNTHTFGTPKVGWSSLSSESKTAYNSAAV